MKHFRTSDWTDLVRGVAGVRDRRAMESHLASGCKSCRKVLDMLGKVKGAAEAESKYSVPEYAVRMAKELFVLEKPETVSIFPNVVARLVYDSFQEPLPFGVRSQCRLTRQALYEAGDYCLDLRLEHEQGAAAVTLVGQIADHVQPDRSMENLPVLLVSAGKIVANTMSNALGEFQFEYQPKRHLRLLIESETAEKRIEVPIKQLRTPKPGGSRPSKKAAAGKSDKNR